MVMNTIRFARRFNLIGFVLVALLLLYLTVRQCADRGGIGF